MLLDGIFAAITTPFYTDESLYLRKLESNVEHYSRSPLAGILVLGSTGESAHLNDAESAEALIAAASAAAPNKVLIAGVTRDSVHATLELAEVAARANYDAIMVRMPSYYHRALGKLQILNYYRTIADRCALPVVLYNIPQCVHFDLPVDVVAELAHHPNIIGIKDSAGDIARLRETIALTANAPRRNVTVTPIFEAVTARMVTAASAHKPAQSLVSIEGGASPNSHAANFDSSPAGNSTPEEASTATGLKTRTKEVGFQVMTGAAAILLDSLESGACGAIMAISDFMPQLATDIYNAWKGNDPTLARVKQDIATPISKRVVHQLGIPGIKYACDFNGYFGGNPRSPMLPLTSEQKAEVELLLQNVRN
jgi:dihydrodipicolinate synthase/N-acetylneuraminate lyase